MEIKLEKFVPGGQTLGILPDGKKIFIWGGLPGEHVEVEITKSKKSYSEGIVSKVISANPYRQPAKDSCYLSTSPWQIMDYKYELEQKKKLIFESFLQSNIEIADFEILTDGKQYEYRNKMEYSLWWDNDKNKISLAFHKRGSHQKIPISISSIERPEIFNKATEIIEKLNSEKEEARKYQALMIRCNQVGQVSGGLLEKGKSHPQFKTLSDTLLGRKFDYSPNGFFQINLPVYEMALKEIEKHVDSNFPIVDMYAGVGTIGFSVVKPEQNLVLVETNKNAYNEMKNNGKEFSAEMILSNAEDSLKYITDDINLIVDPPRAGLDKKVIDRILDKKPKKIIYLSCNPITQARDTEMLLKYYEISDQIGFNFFPRTPHIENLIVLERL